MMGWITHFPDWFRSLPHLFIALCVFGVLLAIWLYTRDQNVFQMLGTSFGAVIGMLTGRALANPQAEKPE